MKKILVSIFLGLSLAGFVHAEFKVNVDRRGWIIDTSTGPAFVKTTAVTAVTLPAAGAGYKNCLEYVTFFSTSAYTLNGGSNHFLSVDACGFCCSCRTFHRSGLCPGQYPEITIKSSTTVAGASNVVNWRGFIGR